MTQPNPEMPASFGGPQSAPQPSPYAGIAGHAAAASMTPPSSFGTDNVLDVSVPTREVVHIPFRLSPDPHIYHFKAPKIAYMMLPAIEGGDAGAMNGTMDWLGRGLSDEDNQRILDRLQDENDGLDFQHLSDVIRSLVQRVGGDRPSS